LEGKTDCPRFRTLAASLGDHLPPLARTGAESLLETGIKKSQVVESAFLRNVDYFGIRIHQQRDGLQKTHLHPQGRNRKSKVLVEKPIEMTTAAIEFFCQFANR
jgi:hypothetical protein